MEERNAVLRAALAERMEREAERLVDRALERLYRRHPEWETRYGPTGRAKCRTDLRWSLEHLRAAVAVGEPAMFGAYAAWLGRLLAARGIPLAETRESLLVLAGILAERAAATRRLLRPYLRAALRALQTDGE